MHTSYLLIFFAVKPGIGICDSDDQLGCSFYDGFSVLGGNVVSILRVILKYQSDWCQMKQEVLLLMTLGFTRGWRAAMMLQK